MVLDERQRIVKKTFTQEQLRNMSVDDLVKLVGEAGPLMKWKGKAVVRKADGTIRYAPDAVPGTFNENPKDLAESEE